MTRLEQQQQLLLALLALFFYVNTHTDHQFRRDSAFVPCWQPRGLPRSSQRDYKSIVVGETADRPHWYIDGRAPSSSPGAKRWRRVIHDDNGTMKARQGVFGGYKTVRRKGLCVPKHLSYKKMEGYQCCCAAVVGWVGEGGKKISSSSSRGPPGLAVSCSLYNDVHTQKVHSLSLSPNVCCAWRAGQAEEENDASPTNHHHASVSEEISPPPPAVSSSYNHLYKRVSHWPHRLRFLAWLL